MALHDRENPAEPDNVRAAARRHVNASPITWLLVLPFLGVLIPAFYNKKDPTLAGMPFFYWYQMLWIAVSVAVTVIVYRASRGER